MNPDQNVRKPLLAYAVAIVGAFLIVAFLAMALRKVEPPPLNAARKAERAKLLSELRQAEAQALSTPAWVNKEKGVVRLPIDVAMERTLQAWKNPEAAKAELVARVEKATATPPPAPAKPSEFE